MPKAVRLAGFVSLFAAGALLAVAIADRGRAADTTTTETETTVATTTAPGTTVTTTLEQTTTRRVVVPTAPTTTSGSGDDENVPTWAWVLIGALALGLIVLLVALLSRRGGGMSPTERRRRLDGAIGSWMAQGWALESQGPDSAVLRRGSELILVGVDPAGYVSTRPVVPE